MTPITLIIMFTIGIVAVFTEMLIPGMIVGICGAICMITSIIYAYQKDFTMLGHILLGCSIFSIPILIIIWYKVFSKTFAMKKTEQGFTSTNEEFKELVNLEGVALTPLHPSGIAIINEKRVDVVAAGPLIEKNTKVRVTEVEGNKIVVKAIKV